MSIVAGWSEGTDLSSWWKLFSGGWETLKVCRNGTISAVDYNFKNKASSPYKLCSSALRHGLTPRRQGLEAHQGICPGHCQKPQSVPGSMSSQFEHP